MDAKELEGFSIWLPIMDGDNVEAAQAQAGSFPDGRVKHSWDSERRFGALFAKTLKLKGIAWDVYLLYEPGVTWTEDEPPEPTFWMHQLPVDTGAAGTFLLNPGRLFYELMKLLGRGDAHKAWDQAFMLHVKGLGAVKRESVESSMDDVLKAVDTAKAGV